MVVAKSVKRKSERPALQQRSQENRELLVKAGFKAFARDGYDGARIADIASEAGISIGAFYHRFGDKRGFFDVLVAEFVRRGIENWDRFFAQANTAWTTDQLFEHMVAGMAHTIRRNVGFFHAYLSLGREDASIAAVVANLDLHAAKKLYQLLDTRGIAQDKGITEEMAHFGIKTVGKTLAFTAVIEGDYYRANDPEMIRKLATMLRHYLNI